MPDQSPTFFSRSRAVAWAELSAAREFDLLIVGGGITGAGLARAAAGQGLTVALVEQKDFASGTSSRSSRLIHGGLRYLVNGQVSLVRQSLGEQERLAHAAPHLARPLTMLLPLYGKNRARARAYRGGMQIYKRLHPVAARHHVETLSAWACAEREPVLYGSGDDKAALQGGFAFREYLTHDARLVWETVLDAQMRGACAVNYASLVNLITDREGRIAGGHIEDALTKRVIEVRARIVVNTTGPWSDRFIAQCALPSMPRPRLRLTKGVHIIIARRHLPLTHGVIFFSPRDRRPLIAIPMENMVIIGTTETDFDGDDPGAVRADADDTTYLLEAAQGFFGAANLTTDAVIASWAGVRPLYDDAGGAQPAGEISREYRIEWHADNLLAVLGGKLTLHARAADDALCVILPKLGRTFSPAKRETELLPGAVWQVSMEETMRSLSRAGIETESIAHLVRRYGSRSLMFADPVRENPAWRARIAPEMPDILAELVFAARAEMAVHLSDFTDRRTDLSLHAKAENVRLPLEIENMWSELSEARA